jgi:hypothetical protein
LPARIHAFVRAPPGDASLAPEVIASAHHISGRYLHKLFHEEGWTVGGCVRERRLERCRRDLAGSRLASRPIAAIAARWGFGGPAQPGVPAPVRRLTAPVPRPVRGGDPHRDDGIRFPACLTVLITGAVSTWVVAGSTATRVVRYRYSSR